MIWLASCAEQTFDAPRRHTDVSDGAGSGGRGGEAMVSQPGSGGTLAGRGMLGESVSGGFGGGGVLAGGSAAGEEALLAGAAGAAGAAGECSTSSECNEEELCVRSECRAAGCSNLVCAHRVERAIYGSSETQGELVISWTEAALELDVMVSDATPHEDSPVHWEDDSVEVYLDLNRGRTTSFESDDFQIAIRRSGAVSGIGNVDFERIGLDHESVPGGYSLRASIPWSALGAPGLPNRAIGFDFGINDDVDGGAREAQLMLFGTLDNYRDTSGYGEVLLE